MRKLTSIQSAAPGQNVTQPVGQPIKHESADRQVSGEAQFVDDYVTPLGCLHGAVVTATIAKGKISQLDVSQTKQADGVIAVLDFTAIPGEKDIGTIFKGDPLLAIDGEIRYYGQPIVLVIATSHQKAWQAAQLADISYVVSDNVTISYQQASEHLLPRHQMGNLINQQTFTDADITIQGEMQVGGQEHFYLEGQVSLAEITEEGGIFLRSSTQNPTEVQKLVAEVLDIDFNRVTVDTRRMGGAFGGKESQAAEWACLAALGAKYTRRAVKIRLPRSIDMTVTGKRHPFYQHYQLAASADGKINAAQIEVNGLCGHSADLSDAIVDRAMFHADNAYFLGQACIIGNRLKTDTVSHTAFRGFGGPQGMIVIEKALQQISIVTQQDALDVRYKNLYHAEQNITPYGMEVVQHESMLALLKQLEQNSDYRERREQVTVWNNTNPVLKKGLALTPVKFGISFTAKHLNQAGALIHIYTDGSVQISHGGTEMGQGLHTKIQQIVAQTLGIELNKVLVTSTRTDKVPNTSPTAASSGADLNGMAAHNAALTIKQRLLEFAREHYQLNAGHSLDIQHGQLIGLAAPLEWQKLVQLAYLNRISLSTTGYYQTPSIGYDREKASGHPFYYFALGASCSEVMIDTLSGEMSIERVDILHDVGASLNPAIDRGQIEGGFIQGVGWLTTEELVWNAQGRLLSNSPMNYKIPTVGDHPKQLNIELFHEPNPEFSIYQSKAVGEPPFMHAISVWCAIYDAIASISNHRYAPQLHAPAAGEAILNACQEQLHWLGQSKSEGNDGNL